MEEKTVTRLSRGISNPSLANNWAIPTSDFLLGELDELETESCTSWRGRAFAGWPIPVTEDVTAFEDAELLEPAVIDDKSVRQPKTISVTLSIPQEARRSFTYIVVATTTAPYNPTEERFGPSARQSLFYPDFFNIKRVVAYIMGKPHASVLEQQETSKALRGIPVALHPQVVREAEEESLTDDLETSIKLAQETYCTLKKIEVNVEHDPEILDRETIRFTLTVSGKPDTVLENEALFKHRLRSSIAPRARELITVTYSRGK